MPVSAYSAPDTPSKAVSTVKPFRSSSVFRDSASSFSSSTINIRIVSTSLYAAIVPHEAEKKLKIWCDWGEKCGNGRKQDIRRFTQAGTLAQLRIDCPSYKNHCICKRNICANQTSVRIAQKALRFLHSLL